MRTQEKSDKLKAMSVANIMAMKRRTLPFEGEWQEAFGQPEYEGAWIIYGKSGQGKTSFALQLAKALHDMGLSILFLSLEMGFSRDYKDGLKEVGFNEYTKDFGSIDHVEDLQQLQECLSKERSADVIFVDSVQYLSNLCNAKSDDFLHLHKKYRGNKRTPGKIFIYISHVDGKEVDGKVAYEVKRDCFKRIYVEGFKASYMGRGRGGEKGYYVVWEEGYQKYWLENLKNKENENTTND